MIPRTTWPGGILLLALLALSCGTRSTARDAGSGESEVTSARDADHRSALQGAGSGVVPGPKPASPQGGSHWAFGESLPGAPLFDPKLVSALDAAWRSRDPGYKPRTRHLLPDGSPQYTNRLFLESSPYLLQHAHNPVNWFPWGDEAFETAKRLGRPIFLSVGYSTCHWCHVMEEESFEDEEIARYLNENYVAIKVDREERPDVDAIYMAAVQLMTGRGGWPMSVWLTPDRKPFYGGTYFPARDGDRGASTGFLTIIRKLKEAYVAQASQVATNSTALTNAVVSQLSSLPVGTDLPRPEVLTNAAKTYSERFDGTQGGLTGSPKFPSNLPIRFLLRYYRRTGNERFLRMATLTLDKMAAGGMCDQVGGGFHRYSTDDRWLVPHFEKMLYDNALLTLTYLEGYQVTGTKDYARVAREILRYADRDMGASEGGFYSATDADSPMPSGPREEGWFFTWTPTELEAVLGKYRARVLAVHYGVTPGGNFEGRSILYTARTLEDTARQLKIPTEKLASIVRESNELLYRARARRPHPHRDEKILAAWNGLMISAFARGAFVLGDNEYARRAERTAEFVLTHMRQNGRLLRSYRDGRAGLNAYLDDYAFMIAGLLDLYEATGRPRWLREAKALDSALEKHYEDAGGGYFMTADDHEKLLAREMPSYDGAEPSGNSVQALNLLRLAEFTTQDRYRERADRLLRRFKARLAEARTTLSELLLAVDFRLDAPKEVIIVVPRSRADAEPFLARLRTTFLPNRVLAVTVAGPDQKDQGKLVSLLADKIAQGGKTTAYVCEGGVCRLPTTDPEVFARQIRETRPLDAVPPKSSIPPLPGG